MWTVGKSAGPSESYPIAGGTSMLGELIDRIVTGRIP